MNEKDIVNSLEKMFQNLGADASAARTMAGQLWKRSGQRAAAEGIPRELALETLLKKVMEGRSGIYGGGEKDSNQEKI